MKSPFWKKHVYFFVVIGCGLFVLLTVIAMFTYPGGTSNDEWTDGYDFFRNFFSDLGRFRLVNGQLNTVSFILFFIALTVAGSSLILFFIAYRNFFIHDRINYWLSLVGTSFGVVAGICFIGVAFTPYDLFLDMHVDFVFWAFRTFLITVCIFAVVVFRQNNYPRKYGWIFLFFAFCLAGYILLLEFGPSAKTPSGMIIQATGQKLIVYISILTAMVQSWLAYRIDLDHDR
jgi:hypothetical protein